ncbi:S-adenosyl-L-methionine-dependent methyltransferase [Tothia fuscella]|uniref:type I protein arginine methyltransferase n=1 Tax=Tothia fuscella TaxID=1048955 RepID=A0A9P4TWE5_9PEZI|nr:S-adenosyl-L-methionine-dependent methyltransferase [Tothia fuscella]
MNKPELPSSSSSDASSLHEEEEEGWEDAEPDQEDLQVVSLFDEKTFPDAKSMIEYCKENYGFDFLGAAKSLGLDFYSSVKFVNYIREEVRKGNLKPDVSSASLFEDDRFMKPVLEDDALLFSLDDLTNSASEEQDATGGESDAARKIADLEEQLKDMKSQFSEYRLQVEETLEKRWNDAAGTSRSKASASGEGSGDTKEDGIDFEGDYFESYSYNDIHETMLKDTIRTDAYRDFIYDNKHLFAGKTVLDVGCGTGILSMFCARAGASQVFAVDNSSIIEKAKINVITNNLSDKVTCIRGKIEEVTLPVDKVDIIVSEWMGYCLLFEAMLDSVLWARDRYLKPEGLLVPSHCTLRIAPLEDPEYITENIEFWRDVYGFDMTAMMAKIYDDILVRQVSTKNLAGDSACFMTLPLHTITTADLVFTKEFSVKVSRDIDALSGWVIWFDTFFLTSRGAVLPEDARAESWKSSNRDGVAFTTGPAGKETHWRSGVMIIDRSKHRDIPLKAGETIAGSVEFAKAKLNTRGLEIGVKWKLEYGKKEEAQEWFMR